MHALPRHLCLCKMEIAVAELESYSWLCVGKWDKITVSGTTDSCPMVIKKISLETVLLNHEIIV